MQSGRTIGVDYGTKRVGLAIADPLMMFAQPVGTYPPNEALDVMHRIQQDEGLDRVVVGWPLQEDGSKGKATERVQQYVNRIRKLAPDAEIILQDEWNSSEKAKELIRQSERPSMRSSGKGRIDTAAAGIILQDYLNELA